MSTRRFKSEGLCIGSLCSAAVFRPISVKTALVLCRCSTVSSTFHADLASQACQAPTELTQILPSRQNFLSISCSQLGVPLDFCDTTKQGRSLNYQQVGSSTNLILRQSQQSQHAPASGLSGKECQGLHTQPRILAAFSPNTGRVLRSAFCVGSAFALCVLPAPSITDRPSSQRPSVCLPFNPAGYLLLRALPSVLPSNPSLPGFLLAGRQPCRTKTGNINRGQLPLADLSSGCISRLGHLSVCRVSHRRARLFRTCSPLPELTTHRTHASPNRLEVRRHPSPSTLLAVRPVLRHSDPRGPLREKS